MLNFTVPSWFDLFIIVFFNLILIVFFSLNLNLKAVPPLNLKEKADNVIVSQSKPQTLNSVGLPDPEDEDAKWRKERWETIKKVAIGAAVVIGVLVAGYLGIKYFGG